MDACKPTTAKWVTVMTAIIRMCERIGLALAGTSLIVVMLLVSADAASRYLLGHPIPWSIELVSYYLMVMVAYLGAADTFRRGDHIQLDLFLGRMSPRTKAWTGLFCNFLAAMTFAIIAYGCALAMLDAWHENEYIHGYTAWAVWPSFLPMFLGFALLSIRLVHHCVMLINHGADPALELQEEV